MGILLADPPYRFGGRVRGQYENTGLCFYEALCRKQLFISMVLTYTTVL
jgi:hypothetical protein